MQIVILHNVFTMLLNVQIKQLKVQVTKIN